MVVTWVLSLPAPLHHSTGAILVVFCSDGWAFAGPLQRAGVGDSCPLSTTATEALCSGNAAQPSCSP